MVARTTNDPMLRLDAAISVHGEITRDERPSAGDHATWSKRTCKARGLSGDVHATSAKRKSFFARERTVGLLDDHMVGIAVSAFSWTHPRLALPGRFALGRPGRFALGGTWPRKRSGLAV